jgi:hypothetical protein
MLKTEGRLGANTFGTQVRFLLSTSFFALYHDAKHQF